MADQIQNPSYALPLPRRLTRRQALRLAMVAGLGVAGVGVLAACGPATPAPTQAPAAPAPSQAPAPPAPTRPPAAPAPTQAPAAPAPTQAPAPTAAPAATAAAASTAAAPAAGKKPLVIGKNIDDILTLDPHIAYEDTYLVVLRGCYDTLVSIQPDDASKIVGRLAASWDITPDAKVYTFKLKDTKFSTGNPVTAADVKFSFERMRELKEAPSWLMDPVATIETPDPKTVRITLKDSDSTFLAALTSLNFSVVDSKVVKEKGGSSEPGADKNDKARDWLNQNSAGTGAYVLAGWTHKERVTLKKNPTSWVQPKTDDVIIQGVAETATLKQMLEKGDVDIAWGLLPEQIQAVKSNKDVKIAATPTLGFMSLLMIRDPQIHEAVSKPDVEFALKHAIDYAGIKSLLDGANSPPSAVPIGLAGALDPAKDGIKTDVKKAKELLAAAGYSNGFDVTLSFSSTFVLGGVKGSTLAEKLQADLSQAGVRAKLEPLEQKVFTEKYRGGKIQMGIGGYYIDYPHGIPLIQAWMPTGLISKRLKWEDKDHPAPKLIAQAIKTADQAKQVELMQEAQRALIKNSPYAVLIQPVFSYPHRASVTGVVANSLWNFDPATISKP